MKINDEMDMLDFIQRLKSLRKGFIEHKKIGSGK